MSKFCQNDQWEWKNKKRTRASLLPNPLSIHKNSNFGFVFVLGNPFWPQSSDHAQFVHFACILLKELSRSGYIKIMSSDVNWYCSLSAWFFYKSPTTVANDIEFCAIDMWGWDKLKFFNLPPEINEGIKLFVLISKNDFGSFVTRRKLMWGKIYLSFFNKKQKLN